MAVFEPENWIRVRGKDGDKGEFSIHKMSFVPDAMEHLKDKPALDKYGELVPTKPHLTVSQVKETKKKDKENH